MQDQLREGAASDFHSPETDRSEALITTDILEHAKALAETGDLYDDESQDAVSTRQELREHGTAIGTEIINRLRQNPQGDAEERESLVNVLGYCGSLEMSEQIGSLLDQTDIAYDLLTTLEKFATSANLPQLESLANNLDAKVDPDNNAVSNELLILTLLVRVVSVIRHQELSDEDKKYAENIFTEAARPLIEFDRIHRADGLMPLFDEENIIKSTLPRIIEQRYESQFQVVSYDNDFDHDDEQRSEWSEEKRDFREQQAMSRVAVIRNLYGTGIMPMENITDTESGRFEHQVARLEYLEQGGPYFPTLGVEIEVFAETILPHDINDWDESQAKDYTDELYKKYSQTVEAGVPEGVDGVHEFANDPVRYYGTLSREVQALVDLDLISTNHENPMHLTIGGVSLDGPRGREAVLLLRAIEATGWCVDGERLTRPFESNGSTWRDHKSYEGVRGREYRAMKLSSNTGVEFRTPQFSGLSGLHRTLRSVYYLGAGLKAYQKAEEDQLDATEQALESIWNTFSWNVQDLFEQNGLSNPAQEEWGNEYDEHYDDWRKFAQLIDESKDETSTGYKFVAAMQDLVLQARADIYALTG